MTADEALAALASPQPLDGNWRRFRAAQQAARAALTDLRGDELRRVLPELLRRLEATHDTTTQEALALPVARATLELGEATPFVEQLARHSFTKPWLDALVRLDASGCETWPLVEQLVAHRDVKLVDATTLVAAKLGGAPDVAAQRFERVLAARPEVAVKAAWELTLWKRTPITALVPGLVQLALEGRDEALRIDVLRLVRGQPIDEAQLQQLRALYDLTSAPTELTCALAALFVTHAVKHGQSPAEWLDDARAEVRLAAFGAFISRDALPRKALPVVLSGWRDADPRIREHAERVLREFTQKHELREAELTELLALSATRDEVVVFLAWAAELHTEVRAWLLAHTVPGSPLHAALAPRPTRVCAKCRELHLGQSWSTDWSAPKALDALEPVVTLEDADTESTSLLRCRACFAHFTLYSQSEIDVNSRRDHWSLVRVRLEDLRARYAAHVDFTDPHFTHWLEGAKNDLEHPDPKVRALAQWELSPSATRGPPAR